MQGVGGGAHTDISRPEQAGDRKTIQCIQAQELLMEEPDPGYITPHTFG